MYLFNIYIINYYIILFRNYHIISKFSVILQKIRNSVVNASISGNRRPGCGAVLFVVITNSSTSFAK